MRLFTTKDSFIQASVNYIACVCREQKDVVHIALSGGNTPRPIYQALRNQHDFDIDTVEFFQVDERYVAATHPDSNAHMIRAALAPARFHSFDTSLPIAGALKKYAAELPAQFDLVILGIGSDGHIASLFPHSTALHTSAPVVHTTTDQFVIHDRLTITAPMILKSRHVLVLLKGAEKKAVIEELLHGHKTVDEFPAKILLQHSDCMIYLY